MRGNSTGRCTDVTGRLDQITPTAARCCCRSKTGCRVRGLNCVWCAGGSECCPAPEGQIDVCISSSIEFARHADRYQVLPGHCIGSDGPVQSVLLLANRPAEQLKGERLLVTAESATSVVLLQVLLSYHWKLEGCSVERTTLPWQQALASAPGILLIGDTALQAALADEAPYCYDLGACWREMTGLPFVYALWQVTQRAAETSRTISSICCNC